MHHRSTDMSSVGRGVDNSIDKVEASSRLYLVTIWKLVFKGRCGQTLASTMSATSNLTAALAALIRGY